MQHDNIGQKSKVTAYTDVLIRWRWLVILGSLVVSMLLISGLKNLGFDNDYRVFFSEENPHLKAFEQQQQTYTKNDNIVFAITPNNGDVFTPDVLSAVEEVTREGWRFPFALRVDSITNFQYSHAEGDELIVEDLVENASSYSSQKLEAVKQIALSEPFIVGQLLNKEASMTAVNITFQMPQVEMDEAPRAVAAARVLKAQIEQNYPVTVHLSGVVMLSNAFFEASMQDFTSLVPAMYLVILIAAMLLLRSFSAMIATTLVIFLSMLVGLGFGAWLGIKLTPPSMSATTIITTLAVADSIHIFTTLFAGMRKGMDKFEAIRYTMRLNIGPVFLTSVTTAIGFLSMNTSDAPPFHHLGNMTAAGVMWAFVLSVTLLPALVAVLPLKAPTSKGHFSQWMEKLAEFVIAKRAPVLVVSVIFASLLVAAIPLNTFDDNFVGYFDESVQFRTDTDYINENLTGIYQVQYSLPAGEDYGVSDPEFLHKVDRFVEWFRAQPEVTHVNTFTDTFKRLNKNMHEDNQSYYRLPTEKDLSAQYLLLYELSLPEGLDLNNQMDIGKSSTQIIVTLQDMPSSEIADTAERGRDFLLNQLQLDSYGVGPAVMFAYISETNMKSMLLGTVIAIFVISIIITISLKNIRIGFLSLVPNLLPVATAFGLWALIDGEVNVAVSMVAGMALGIVVDDTVHFLSKYLRAREEQKLSKEDAVRYAFSSVGIAILVTSIILVAGFSILAQSTFGMNSGMAILTAVAIGMALLADFTLLPVLLMKLDKDTASDRGESSENLENIESEYKGKSYA